MRTLYNIIFIACIFPALLQASTYSENLKGKYSKEKTIKKEFAVNANAGLKIDNSYGNLDIVTWEENRTVLIITITTNGDDEKKVAEKLDEITVSFTSSASLVTAKTIFKESSNSWSFWNSKSNNVSMQINYTIKMPITNTVDLDNDYGTIRLSKLKGNAKISCDYGQLILGELLADNNILKFDYTNKSTISYIKSGKIEADYSSFSLEKGDRIELVADYTNSDMGEINNLNYACDYGKITIASAKDVIGSGDYLTTRIGNVTNSLNLNSNYGSISVANFKNTAKSAIIKADYTQVKFGFDTAAAFDFSITLNYASFKGKEQVTTTNSSENSNQKLYSGYFKKQNSGNAVTIRSSYGGVTFIEN